MKVYVAWCKPDNDWDHMGHILGVYTTRVEAKKHCKDWDKEWSVVVPMEVESRYTKKE
jgi:hypothetical protein